MQRSVRAAGVLGAAAAAIIALDLPAWSAEGMARNPEAVLVGQVVLLIATGRMFGEAMLRLGQPAIMGQLLAGILLGPSVLGLLWPEAQRFLFPPRTWPDRLPSLRPWTRPSSGLHHYSQRRMPERLGISGRPLRLLRVTY